MKRKQKMTTNKNPLPFFTFLSSLLIVTCSLLIACNTAPSNTAANIRFLIGVQINARLYWGA